MIEKGIELLLGLAVSAAGFLGVSAVADADAGASVDTAAAVRSVASEVATRVDDARHHVDETRAGVRDAVETDATVGAGAAAGLHAGASAAGIDGQAAAGAALETALERAPESADFGLSNALTHVMEAGTEAHGGEPEMEEADASVDAGASVDVDVKIGADLP